MAKFKIAFQNIFQGLTYAGEIDNRTAVYKYWPSNYIDYYKTLDCDIICLAEIPLDDETGKSAFVEKLSKELNMPYFKTNMDAESWLVEGKFYGTAVISKYPIENYESFSLPNPKLEVDHKDGTHWIMHDKGAQKMKINVDGKMLNLFNLHYFPVHHFGGKIDDEKFNNIRKALADILVFDSNHPTIVTGDFNNKNVELETAFPEIFANGDLKRSVVFTDEDLKRDPQKANVQIDHILYSPKSLKFLEGRVDMNISDHLSLVANFEI